MKTNRWLWATLALLVLLVGCSASTTTSQSGVEEAPMMGVTGYSDLDGRTGITGKVFLKGSGDGLGEAFVNIYPDTTSNLLGPSQYISSPTASSGNYTIDVPPGTYYVVARKRMTGEASGPLAPGDYYSEHRRILVEVKTGKVARVDLEVVPMKAPMFFKKNLVERKTDTGIRGRLIDATGKPVPGSFAIAYVDRDLKRLPDFASTLSDADGQFTIYLPDGGIFYLAARVHAWDMPRTGELYGKLGGEKATPLKVEKGGFVEDVTLTLTPFEGEYKPGKSRRPY